MASADHIIEHALPPVRWAKLTVYYEPIVFQIGMISNLSQKWRGKNYKAIRQHPPQTRPEELPSVDPFRTPWPMPAVEQAGESLNPALSYQFDQISLSWKFPSEEISQDNRYPGFDSLSEELLSRFGDLVNFVNEQTDDSVRVQGARCFYTNTLGSVESVEWAMGSLSNWEMGIGSPSRKNLGLEYLGVSMHRTDVNSNLKTRRSGWVNLDEGENQPGEIDITALVLPDDGFISEEGDPVSIAKMLLIDAHEYQASLFDASFSDEMKKSWGLS
ncbi:hypothetical protein [Nocardia cerradoensis]|uniref:TIGR04255 family protein n=1 Tax=Nocardia cerradoensis TaxID=85688 RepID=A0A231H521_9NOCA|nr:hypothetical protein [Nocardia cerradoensis]NKY44290.1 hypothetical protein [Nocardia cerradoensis]OXR43999.1 hypothetical protein B7C42_03555 [Nocardia cerradoensis]